ncbi:MAG TPA: polymer-forming cytoskeletal protein [Nannocystaceae bacterium]|nr:polymer-forming cytoskeletal protein [Nannocystaceae bacterium]
MPSPSNFIAEDTTIKGSITTASSLTVAGAIEGDINAGGEVNVLADAVVRGDVSGPSVVIAGKVEGRINASGKLLITSSGHVVGDIAVRSLLIEEGGTLQGQCAMGANLPAMPSRGASHNGRALTPPAALPIIGTPPPLRAPER